MNAKEELKSYQRKLEKRIAETHGEEGTFLDRFYKALELQTKAWGNEGKEEADPFVSFSGMAEQLKDLNPEHVAVAAFLVMAYRYAGEMYVREVFIDMDTRIVTDDSTMNTPQHLKSQHPLLTQAMIHYAPRVASMLYYGHVPQVSMFVLENQCDEGEAKDFFYSEWQQFLLHLEVVEEKKRPTTSLVAHAHFKTEKAVLLNWSRIVKVARRMEGGLYVLEDLKNLLYPN